MREELANLEPARRANRFNATMRWVLPVASACALGLAVWFTTLFVAGRMDPFSYALGLIAVGMIGYGTVGAFLRARPGPLWIEVDGDSVRLGYPKSVRVYSWTDPKLSLIVARSIVVWKKNAPGDPASYSLLSDSRAQIILSARAFRWILDSAKERGLTITEESTSGLAKTLTYRITPARAS